MKPHSLSKKLVIKRSNWTTHPNIYGSVVSRQGDQDTTKVGKHISRALSKVLHWLYASTIQCGRSMLRQTLPAHATPTLDEASCPNC